MKSIASKLIVAVIPLIAMTTFIAVSSGIAKKVERCQSSAMVFSQPLGNSYAEMINSLFMGR